MSSEEHPYSSRFRRLDPRIDVVLSVQIGQAGLAHIRNHEDGMTLLVNIEAMTVCSYETCF